MYKMDPFSMQFMSMCSLCAFYKRYVFIYTHTSLDPSSFSNMKLVAVCVLLYKLLLYIRACGGLENFLQHPLDLPHSEMLAPSSVVWLPRASLTFPEGWMSGCSLFFRSSRQRASVQFFFRSSRQRVSVQAVEVRGEWN